MKNNSHSPYRSNNIDILEIKKGINSDHTCDEYNKEIYFKENFNNF